MIVLPKMTLAAIIIASHTFDLNCNKFSKPSLK